MSSRPVKPEPHPNVFKMSAEIIVELGYAQSRFPPFNSAHEGFAVILEEVDELKAEVWKSPSNRDMMAMRREAIQIAAMAMRFMHDCCPSVVYVETPTEPDADAAHDLNDELMHAESPEGRG